jgi:energy-coupling factor transporter ATP-binding protein EcfA2
MIISGRSGSGKTTLLSNLLTMLVYYAGEFDQIYVFCPTVEWDPLYKNMHLNPNRTFAEYTDNRLIRIINQLLDDRRKGVVRKVLFIFDDCGAEKNIKHAGNYANIMDKLAYLIRHWGFSAIWVAQDITSLSNPVRKNADGAAVFETLNYQELVTLYQTFGCGKLDTFRRLLSRATNEDFSFLFVHRQGARCKYHKRFNILLVPPDE